MANAERSIDFDLSRDVVTFGKWEKDWVLPSSKGEHLDIRTVGLLRSIVSNGMEPNAVRTDPGHRGTSSLAFTPVSNRTITYGGSTRSSHHSVKHTLRIGSIGSITIDDQDGGSVTIMDYFNRVIVHRNEVLDPDKAIPFLRAAKQYAFIRGMEGAELAPETKRNTSWARYYLGKLLRTQPHKDRRAENDLRRELYLARSPSMGYGIAVFAVDANAVKIAAEKSSDLDHRGTVRTFVRPWLTDHPDEEIVDQRSEWDDRTVVCFIKLRRRKIWNSLEPPRQEVRAA